jgi:hypothetical protein
MGLMGRDLVCKLRAQIPFVSDGTAGLKLRGPEAKTLILTVTQEDEWQLYVPERRPPEIPELPFKVPGVWAEDNPPGLARNVLPVVMELKPGATPSAKNSTSFPTRPRSEIKNTLTDS